nr:vacuolar fusion protein mon1 [Quercus suber]
MSDVMGTKPTVGGDENISRQAENVDMNSDNSDVSAGPVEVIKMSRETTPPPLPPRPALNLTFPSNAGSLRLSSRTSRPQLQSQATTAVSLADARGQGGGEHAGAQPSFESRTVSRRPSVQHISRVTTRSSSVADESAGRRSYAPTLNAKVDYESDFGDGLIDSQNQAWKSLSAHTDIDNPFDKDFLEEDPIGLQLEREFDEIDTGTPDEEARMQAWKAKLKHFFILSASGKPIYSRHGDDQLISNHIGIAQTLISFYQDAGDCLKGFTARGTRFVVLSKGPLSLIATSRLAESDAQLRIQLESLYTQILSTLTLPTMEKMFSHRPSVDLRRSLQGTDVLLDGLADGFTRGSPSTLLSALECLRLRKGHRQTINDTLLKARSPNLLYGMIVANGRLVSVVRPKKHSLHPGDLHLIFNMLFEAGSIKAGGGENWIPLCLPGFNNTGFLYMYVSFFSPPSHSHEQTETSGRTDELAIVLISANKDSFFELRSMRNDLVEHLEENGSLSVLATAIESGPSTCSEILPGTVVRHFLYKSRGNVQFTMPSFSPDFGNFVARRKLMSMYHKLHDSIHSRTSHLKVQHFVAKDATAVAWETPLFELYCVAGPSAPRAALVQGANRLVQWIRREEERVFIIGGAVF